MKYMLDTNIVIYVKNNSPEHVTQTFQKFSPDDLCISSITLAELEYGICNSSQPERNRIALTLFLANINILPFDSKATIAYGEIRASLKKKGQTIGGNDMLIAAHAQSANLTLVTHNTKEFSRIDGLNVKNWV